MPDRLVIQPQPSVMSAQQHFSAIPRAEIQRSTFDRSHALKTTFDAGLLIPVLVDEMLPGSTRSCNANFFARLATPLKAPMDNMYLDSFFFFVPNRLIFDRWREMNGQQRNPSDSTDYEVPVIQEPFTIATGDIGDYFQLPLGTYGPDELISALPFRCYNLIWNEWFRCESLQNSVVNNVGVGTDAYTDYSLLRRGKRLDYFTSALPWPQKGPAVLIPVGSDHAPLYGHISGPMYDDDSVYTRLNDNSLSQLYQSGGLTTRVGVNVDNPAAFPVDSLIPQGVRSNSLRMDLSNGSGFADLSSAFATSINALRQAFQLQILFERDARGGTRYTEIVRSHFGVVSPDARLQRPEFLGGGSTPVNIHPVANTSDTGTGVLASFGTVTASQGHGFTYSATEHGWIIGLISVRADLTYQQGIDKMWSRRTRYDFAWPAFAHLGEQTILNKEIFKGSPAPNGVWGYQERYAEYRYKPSRITGLMRSDAATSLDIWHLSQDFDSLPALNGEFIQDNPPIDRIIAVPSEPHFILDAWFRYRAAEPLPVYSVPGLIDHF